MPYDYDRTITTRPPTPALWKLAFWGAVAVSWAVFGWALWNRIR
jgi:hypothetical protein